MRLTIRLMRTGSRGAALRCRFVSIAGRYQLSGGLDCGMNSTAGRSRQASGSRSFFSGETWRRCLLRVCSEVEGGHDTVISWQDKKLLGEDGVVRFDAFFDRLEIHLLMVLPGVTVLVVDLHQHQKLAFAAAFREFVAVDLGKDARGDALVGRKLRVGDLCAPANVGLIGMGQPLVERDVREDGIRLGGHRGGTSDRQCEERRTLHWSKRIAFRVVTSR